MGEDVLTEARPKVIRLTDMTGSNGIGVGKSVGRQAAGYDLLVHHDDLLNGSKDVLK